MKDFNKLLSQVEFYSCSELYNGYSPQDDYLVDCPLEYPKMENLLTIIGDCGGECWV